MKDVDDTPAHIYEEKVVSLNLELANLEHALRGAHLLAELLANNDMPTEDADRQAPRSIVAILALADSRLQQLRRVIRGEADARHLWAPHNAISPEPLPGDEEDVRLEPRSASGPSATPGTRKRTDSRNLAPDASLSEGVRRRVVCPKSTSENTSRRSRSTSSLPLSLRDSSASKVNVVDNPGLITISGS
ncbi:hypothetical protein COCOR_04425 [Corallococcus coralloides DSM 2259]|uniref:Uncharacterized protein n=1 Tax=Corallococcus coralloides (strain ATCC 25202 / DSM 2259 / NBRC 100086 / M2) TaxID=1144275 RepID=H8MFA6_CORCM|nr:hypothetical protein COCOR_04425 [Corallococcus coralloides DSM 2259]